MDFLFRAFPGLMSSRNRIFDRPLAGGGVASPARQKLIPIKVLATFSAARACGYRIYGPIGVAYRDQRSLCFAG
jgi:hypothetical protein